MPVDPLSCAVVHSRLRGGGAKPRLRTAHLRHIEQCPRCGAAQRDYKWLASELAKLRDTDPLSSLGAADTLISRLDFDIGRRLRRTRTIATVAGGLAVASAAGVCTHLVRSRPTLWHSN